MPTMTYRDDEVEVLLDDRMVLLEVYEHQSSIHDNCHSYAYFHNLVSFLSDLCLDKNFIAINELKNIFPLEMCTHILQSPKYDL
jgi:hypothetical protein